MRIKDNLLTEGVLLLLLPAAGYWFAFLYEYGFCLYFDVPPSLISISPEQILYVTVIFLIFMFYFVGMLDPVISKLLSKVENGMKFNIIRDIIIISGSLSLLTILNTASPYTVLSILVAWFLMSGFDFVFPLFDTNSGLTYSEKYELIVKQEREYCSKQETVTGNLINTFGLKYYRALIIFIIVSFFIFSAGGFSAIIKTDFIVYKNLSNEGESVVLKIYNSKFITVEFDRETKSTLPNYKIIHINESDQEFSIENLGHLTPYKHLDNADSSQKNINNLEESEKEST